MRPDSDHQLVQILDAATADAARRSGDWLPCRLGCNQCCVGVFSISQLDAARLREGLVTLDPEKAAAVRRRAEDSLLRLQADFPGDPETGQMDEEDPRFEAFANEEPCPALDPATGGCDLYAFRPVTCRVFGPPVPSEDGLGVCELCFVGASDEEIAAAQLDTNWSGIEDTLISEVERQTGQVGPTTVAHALAKP